MSIDVYWSVCDPNWLLQKSLDSVVGKFYSSTIKTNDPDVVRTNKCPAVYDELHNMFNVYSLYDYEFELQQNGVSSNKYDQQFFDHHVEVRSLKNKFVSYHQHIILFTEEKSLPTTVSMFPYMENNNITQRCNIIPGRFDIGKWFRKVDFAFFLKEPYTNFKVNKDEVLYYIKFHTDKKINLKQFVFNETLEKYSRSCSSISSFSEPLIKLENYYKMFKHKRLILKEIKNNLL